MALQRLAAARLGKDVLDLEGVTVPDPRGGPPLLADVTWRLAPGQRVGVLGANGAGKTTLLRVLAGAVPPAAGRVRRGKTVAVALLSQDVAELDEIGHRRAVEAVEDVARSVDIGGRELTASQLVEQLGFPRARAWTPVSQLSGGERRRLQLLRLLLGRPNVLLLDEPTNDLDTDALAALEDVLDSFAGTLVVVSHDRYLLERVCDGVVGLPGDGSLRDLPRGVEEYLELHQPHPPQPHPSRGDHAPPRDHRPGGPQARREAPGSVGPSAGEHAKSSPDLGGSRASGAELRAARKEAARLERRLDRLATRERELHTELASVATDAEAVRALDAELRALAAEKDHVEADWLTAAETAEAGRATKPS